MEQPSVSDSSPKVADYSLFTAADIQNFKAGTHNRLYEKLGSHFVTVNNTPGVYFAVWAANATAISVIGDFNQWQHGAHPLRLRTDDSGIWEGFIAGRKTAELYKYHVVGNNGWTMDKGDPFAHCWELRPATASRTWDLQYEWQDDDWLKKRKDRNALTAPWSVYEVHLLSWMRPDKDNEQSVNTYQQAIELLVPYVKEMGFTHVELMPIMEHPNDASWGYQGTGFFAPTSRFGSPQDFMKLVNAFHQQEIGVILDWVPSHFPYDAHGLYMFDGTHAYENPDMRRGYHPDWHSYIFNYGKGEVKSFLISSARFWVDIFHADGIRVDGVSSMLILSYSRGRDQWEPNEWGGDSNLEAISFLRDLNESIYKDFPDVQVIAEESTAWQGVSRPAKDGGLGFGMKWMMGWMHDTLEYFTLNPLDRKTHQDKFTLSMEYYYNENFMLALSHDEVVYGKRPMIYKMPGDEWERFANLRLLYSYMFTHPGGKLLFMGDEFGSTSEWDFRSELPWNLLQWEPHQKLKKCVRDLCFLLRAEPALYECQFSEAGFEWIDRSHQQEMVVVYRRKGLDPANDLLVILHMGEAPRRGWQLMATGKNNWKEIFNSDAEEYWGSGQSLNPAPVIKSSTPKSAGYQLTVNLPALGAIVLK